MQLDRTSLELRHKSIQHHGKSTRSQQQHVCVFGVIVVIRFGIIPLLCLGRLYCSPWSQNHPSFPFILPVFLSVSTSWGFIVFQILDVFPSLCCFRLSNLSDPLWLSLSLSLSDSSPSLFSPCAPVGCQVQVSFFHSCHRHSPSHSKYTWLNIGPQMIIKTQQPPGLLKFGRQTTPCTSSVS